MKARCNGCGLSAVPSPSGVVTSLSATDHSGVSQAETAWSPTMTWQAPHSPAPQPKCAPVRPSRPRRTSSSIVSGSASTSVATPLRRNRVCGMAEDVDSGAKILGLSFLDLVSWVLECLDDLGPFHNIAAQEFVEFLRRHRHRHRALFAPELDDVRPLYDRIHRRVELVDDRLRRAGRRHQPEPDRRLVAANARLDRG